MNELHPVSELMNEACFWAIINQSLAVAEAENDDIAEQQETQFAALKAALLALDWQDIIAFENRFDQLHFASYRQDLWCAAYLMCGGCSDDGFDYFRYWLVSRGQAVFQAALANPDSLADYPFVSADSDYYEFEDFGYAAHEAFEEKTGSEMSEYLDNAFTYPEIEFAWSDEEPESMARICPKLFAEFGDECF